MRGNKYMITWIKNINWLRVFLSGLTYTVIAMVIHQIEALLTMKYYLDPEYFGLWSKLMMPASPSGGPAAGPPPMSFFITSLVLTYVTGVSVTVIYYYIKDILPHGFWKKTFMFADLMVGTSFIFSTIPIYLMFNVPIGLLVSWFFSSFIILLLSTIALVKIVK